MMDCKTTTTKKKCKTTAPPPPPTRYLIFERAMVEEIFSAALVSVALPNHNWDIIEISKERGFDIFRIDEIKEAIVFGSYIRSGGLGLKRFKEILSDESKVISIPYNNGSPVEFAVQKRMKVKSNQRLVDVTCDYINSMPTGKDFKVGRFKRAIAAIQSYCSPKRTEESQHFMDGIYDHFNSGDGTKFELFVSFFNGKLKYKDLIARGKIESSKKLHLINSLLYRSEVKRGIAFVNVGVYVGISHGALKEKYRACRVSVVYYHNSKDRKWSCSMRSYDNKVDVSRIARKNKGGGLKDSAGFTCKNLKTIFSIKIPN